MGTQQKCTGTKTTLFYLLHEESGAFESAQYAVHILPSVVALTEGKKILCKNINLHSLHLCIVNRSNYLNLALDMQIIVLNIVCFLSVGWKILETFLSQ